MLLYGEAGRKRPAALIDIYSPTVTAASNAVDESHTALRSLGTYLLPDLHAYLDVSWREFLRVVGALRWRRDPSIQRATCRSTTHMKPRRRSVNSFRG